MTSFLDKLNLQPQERRLVVGIMVAVFVILNYVLVWPYLSEWSTVRNQIETANSKIATFNREIELDRTAYKPKLEKLDKKGPSIALNSGDIQLQQAIMAKTKPDFMPGSYTPGKPSQTNEFFEEQSIRITVDCEEKPLVDFLYDIGGDNSMIRVRSLSLKPLDNNRYKLSASVDLSASYQKKVEAKPATPGPAKPGLTKPGVSKPAMIGNKPVTAPPGPAKPTPQTPVRRPDNSK